MKRIHFATRVLQDGERNNDTRMFRIPVLSCEYVQLLYF